MFRYESPADSAVFRLADEAFHAFNAPLDLVLPGYRGIAESYRSAGLRSLSVGDVLRLGNQTWLACAATGWLALADAPIEVHDD